MRHGASYFSWFLGPNNYTLITDFKCHLNLGGVYETVALNKAEAVDDIEQAAVWLTSAAAADHQRPSQAHVHAKVN